MLGVANGTTVHALGNIVARTCQKSTASVNVTVENLTIFTLDQTAATMLQHVATRRNWMAKRAQHAAPNNVVICWVEMLPLTDNST